MGRALVGEIVVGTSCLRISGCEIYGRWLLAGKGQLSIWRSMMGTIRRFF